MKAWKILGLALVLGALSSSGFADGTGPGTAPKAATHATKNKGKGKAAKGKSKGKAKHAEADLGHADGMEKKSIGDAVSAVEEKPVKGKNKRHDSAMFPPDKN